jgi:membrane protein YqaA with SNARE-associated domain
VFDYKLTAAVLEAGYDLGKTGSSMTNGPQTAAAASNDAAPHTAPAKAKGPLRGLYNWLLRLAASRHAQPALFAVSFAESSFFPVPPDVMLAPMCFARPERSFRYAAVCAAGSVLGAILGWVIGYYLGESLGKWILTTFGLMARFEQFKTVSAEWAPAWILAQGLIPVPYKLVTIACGMLNVSLAMLVGCSIITRSTRFFAVAFVCKKFGPALAPVIEKRIGLFMLLIAVVLVGAIAALALIH